MLWIKDILLETEQYDDTSDSVGACILSAVYLFDKNYL